MDNRRRDYRHPFPLEDGVRVEIQLPGQHRVLAGRLADLSLGGMRIWLHGRSTPLTAGVAVLVRATAPGGSFRLLARAEVVHCRQDADGWYHGLRFLSAGAATEEDAARERTIWRFLLHEQQRAVRVRRWAASLSYHGPRGET